jgi:hypothetical protein
MIGHNVQFGSRKLVSVFGITKGDGSNYNRGVQMAFTTSKAGGAIMTPENRAGACPSMKRLTLEAVHGEDSYEPDVLSTKVLNQMS